MNRPWHVLTATYSNFAKEPGRSSPTNRETKVVSTSPSSLGVILLIHSDWTSFRVFFRVSWEPFEARFDGINLQFREHIDIVIRTANVVEYERVWSKEILEKLKEDGMFFCALQGIVSNRAAIIR